MPSKCLGLAKNKSLQYHRGSIHLGARLAAVADLVQRVLAASKIEGDVYVEKSTCEGNTRAQWTLADIGSDHAYLPAFLLRQGAIKRAIAVDIHEGPYQNMLRTAELSGLNGDLEARRGDGLSALRPEEAQIIVLAGMGGATMEKILRSGEAVIREAQGLVLQPQNAYEDLYHTLWGKKWKLVEEVLAAEGREIYRLMAWQREGYSQNQECEENEKLHDHLCEKSVLYQYGQDLQGWDETDAKMNIIRWREAISPEAEAEVFTKCVWLLGPKNVARGEELRERGNSSSGELLRLLVLQELTRLSRVRAGLSQSGREENEQKCRRIAAEERIWKDMMEWLFS